MKVFLLEHPRRIAPDRCNDIANTPLASSLVTGSIAGLLSSMGHDITIAEGFLDRLTYTDIYRQVSALAPPVLGVHLIYNWSGNRELFTFLKGLKEEGLVGRIMGYGYYPTFAYREILAACPAFDGLIIGEPELTFAEWLGSGAPVPGMAWVDEAGRVQMRRREVNRNLDALPDPVRSGAMMRMEEVNIEGSRGCYGSCTFCYINPYYGAGPCWRAKSPERVMREVDRIVARYGTRRFYFTDPNFFGPGRQGQQRALKLAAMLKERNIRFGIEARVNDIHQDTVAALADAGLDSLLIGLESGLDDSLRRLNKMTTVEQNERALRILRANGIEPYVGFIMFEPDSTLADIRANFAFLQRNALLKDVFTTANVLYHPQIILRGTRAYRDLQQEGRLVLKGDGYEGTAAFKVPAVARLAEITGRITNYFFLGMDPLNAANLYETVNELLVNCFEENLRRLEAGETINGVAAQAVIDEAIMEIKFLFEEGKHVHSGKCDQGSHPGTNGSRCGC